MRRFDNFVFQIAYFKSCGLLRVPINLHTTEVGKFEMRNLKNTVKPRLSFLAI